MSIRIPYVGTGADGARRSARIDYEQADGMAFGPDRDRVLASAAEWDAQAAAADERARLVWWLRAGLDGPAAVGITPGERALIVYLAEVIEQHPERFADAPTTEGVRS